MEEPKRKRNQRKNQKKEPKEKPIPIEYKCPICRKVHTRNEICPIVDAKLNNSKPEDRVHIFGNILLECIKRNVRYQEILEEIAYLDTIYSNEYRRGFNADLMINYFASALNCSPSLFLKKAKKTNEEYAERLEVDYQGKWKIIKDDSNKTVCIIMPVELIDNQECIEKITKMQINGRISKYKVSISYLCLCKEKIKNTWIYTLKLTDGSVDNSLFLDTQEEFMRNNYLQDRFKTFYHMMDIDDPHADFTLAVDVNGALKDFFEDNIDTYWTEIAECIPLTDTRFPIWIEKLSKATKQGLIEWRKIDVTFYSGSYKDKEIEITLKEKEWTTSSDCLYIRFEWDFAICFSNLTEDDDIYHSSKHIEVAEIRELVDKIEKSIIVLNDEKRLEKLQEKRLKYSDIAAVTYSMICKENNHTIIPYKGLVPILDKENKEQLYEIYVGYCKECNCFYMFRNDFDKMLEVGKPLCKVIRIDRGEKLEDSDKGFQYRSESVLHVLGYNVRANNNLTQEQRQQILLNAIEQDLLQAHEILDFLNWLVKINTSKRGYSSAIDKWRTDIEYIKNTALENADSTTVSTIYVK